MRLLDSQLESPTALVLTPVSRQTGVLIRLLDK